MASESQTAQSVCPICRNGLEGKVRFQNARGQIYCYDCHMKSAGKRIARGQAAMTREDVLEKRRREMREAISQRDRHRKERDAVLDELRRAKAVRDQAEEKQNLGEAVMGSLEKWREEQRQKERQWQEAQERSGRRWLFFVALVGLLAGVAIGYFMP